MDTIADFIANFTTAVDFQDPVELRAQSVLVELPEWDSLAALGVIVMCDMEYGVTITGSDLKGCNSLGDVFALVAARKA
ncbi:MAG: acyl carrier protein [Burkholderiales bacterium]|nr:acyl carrier protein [Burkholderiales bacterium]